MIRSLNPFLFIRGLSCPCRVQTSLTQNCLKLAIPGFPYNILPLSCGAGDICFFKNPRSGIGLEIGLQSVVAAFTTLLPSENNSAKWLEGQHCPLWTYHGVFFKGIETLCCVKIFFKLKFCKYEWLWISFLLLSSLMHLKVSCSSCYVPQEICLKNGERQTIYSEAPFWRPSQGRWFWPGGGRTTRAQGWRVPLQVSKKHP